jgi:hypothetical protein
MGKPTGFLEFDRVKEHYAPVEERGFRLLCSYHPWQEVVCQL